MFSRAVGRLAFGLVLAFGAFGGIWATGSHDLAVAAGLLIGGLGIAAFLATYLDRPLGHGLIRLGRAMSGDLSGSWVDPATVIAPPAQSSAVWQRTSVIVGLSPVAATADVASRSLTDDPAPRAFVRMDWHFASWTAMDLAGAYLTLVESEDALDATQQDRACLFRWHADIFDAVTPDVFRVNHLAVDGHPVALREQRSRFNVRYDVETDSLPGPWGDGRLRLVTYWVSLARSERGDQQTVSLPFFLPTEDAQLLIDARTIGAVDFDVHNKVAGFGGRPPRFYRWRDLYGRNNEEGLGGGLLYGAIAGGSLDVVIVSDRRANRGSAGESPPSRP